MFSAKGCRTSPVHLQAAAVGAAAETVLHGDVAQGHAATAIGSQHLGQAAAIEDRRVRIVARLGARWIEVAVDDEIERFGRTERELVASDGISPAYQLDDVARAIAFGESQLRPKVSGSIDAPCRRTR